MEVIEVDKKISLSLVAIFILMPVLFLGCSSDQGGEKPLLVWHWLTDREEALNQIAQDYEQLTGQKVRFELYAPSDVYSSKVIAACQTNTLPDIFGILGEKRVFASFIKAGHIMDLTEEMNREDEKWVKQFFEKAVDVNRFKEDNEFGIKPGIYGVPIDVTNIQMLYNKDLFKKAGLDSEKPPETWKEFLEVGKKLKKAGIQGMVSGWGEIWMIECLARNFAFNIMGEDKVVATFKGEVPYTDPDWVKVLSLFKDMQDSGILAKGIVIMINKNAEQNFANGRAAMAFNGSWCVNVYSSMNPDLNYGVFPPPKVSDKYPRRIRGGAGSSFIVNAKSKKKGEAVGFLKWLTAPEQQAFLARETKNLPSNRFSLKDIPPILAEFADDMDIVTHPHLLPASEKSRVIEAFNKGIQSIIIGDKTPEEVAQEVDRIKKKELKKT